jgi:23S rRNA (guanosine2251-2'-O)-methyltransferase
MAPGPRRRGLRGKGPTPPATARTGHPAARRAAAQEAAKARARAVRQAADAPEWVLGRNPVLECLRAKVPAVELLVASGVEADERVAESVRIAGNVGVPITEVARFELDRRSSGAPHQGIGLRVRPYEYRHPDDLLTEAENSGRPALFVALDHISDPRNLGAVVRSTAAFGGHGVLLPNRRSASLTAIAWRTSAGAAARLPVAQAPNLARSLKQWQERGLLLVGLDAEGDTSLDDFTGADPLALVVGSEGKGLSRLVRESCDLVVSIPMSGQVESLNVSVATGVVLAEIARQRRNQR